MSEERETRFEVGDAVVHPVRGAGVVVGIETRERDGEEEQYYRIKPVDEDVSVLMIPVDRVEEMGVRKAVDEGELKKVWEILQGEPHKLPSNYRKRHSMMREKLQTGDILEVAEAVKDMAGRRRGEKGLTTRGKRIYETGLELLAGEIATVEEIPVVDARARIKEMMRETVKSAE